MSDTEIRMMRYTTEQLSAELQAIRQYVSDIKTELDRTRKSLDVAVDALKSIDWCGQDYANAQGALDEIIAPEQKDVK